MKWPTVLVASVLPFLLAGAGDAAGSDDFLSVMSAPEGQSVILAGAIDAETMRLDDGRLIRPAGIHISGDLGLDGIVAAMRSMAGGSQVWLFGVATDPDRKGRISAQLVFSDQQDRPARWLQGELLTSGRAVYFPSTGLPEPLARMMLEREATARRNGRGVWAEPANQVLSAGAPASIQPGFHLVEGRVVSIGESRHSLFLNFGPDYRKDFTVVVQRSDRDGFNGGLQAVKALKGRQIRVRGYVFQRGGPAIRAMHQQVLEILD
jgi:micrococcal nuclease